MATYAIGDIQGCYGNLMQLLDKLEFDENYDVLWFAGDLVNRGPQSLQTLEFIHSLGKCAITVLGNHDLHLLAAAHGARAPHRSDTFDDVLQSPKRDILLDWLRRQPLMHCDKTLNTVMVHAGIYPGWTADKAMQYANEVHEVLRSDHYAEFFDTMYGNQPSRWSEHLKGSDRLRFIVNSFTRMRFVDEEGHLDIQHSGPPGSQPVGMTPWFVESIQLPDSLRVVFGHWAALGETGIAGFHALDSGCVWGAALTAMNVETLEYTSVPCDRVQSV